MTGGHTRADNRRTGFEQGIGGRDGARTRDLYRVMALTRSAEM